MEVFKPEDVTAEVPESMPGWDDEVHLLGPQKNA